MDAFVSEATVDPNGALSVMHELATLTIGVFGHPANLRELAHHGTTSSKAQAFLSNMLSTLYARVIELMGQAHADNLCATVAMYVSPFSMQSATNVSDAVQLFYSERFGDRQELEKKFSQYPLAAMMALLRINMDKLMAIGKLLGKYAAEFNDQTETQPEGQ